MGNIKFLFLALLGNYNYRFYQANKKDIQSGAVMEVPLHAGKGFGYVELILSEDICQHGIYCMIVKIYNKYDSSPLSQSDFKAEEFETDDLLVYPYLIILFLP